MNKYRKQGWMGYRDLLIELVTKDVKLKYRRSFLGYLWSILNPLMIMLVMVIVFSSIFRFDIDHYPVYLIIGQTIYNYVNNATVHAIYSVTDNGALLKKVYVPKYIFPLSKVTSDLVDFLFSLGAMVLVMLITGTQFSVYLILLPYVAIQICVFFGNGYVSGTGIRIFPGYPLYLQCIPYGMDVCNTNFLSSHDAAGQDPVDCDTSESVVLLY